MQLQARIGMAGEQPAVLDQQARIVDRLPDRDPALFPGGGDQEEGARGPGRDIAPVAARSTGAHDFASTATTSATAGEQIAEHHAQGRVRQPRAGDHQGQQQRGPIECASNQDLKLDRRGRFGLRMHAGMSSSRIGTQKPPVISANAERS